MDYIISADRHTNGPLIPSCCNLVQPSLAHKYDIARPHNSRFAFNVPFPLPLDNVPPFIPIRVIMESVALTRLLAQKCHAIAFRVDYALAPRLIRRVRRQNFGEVHDLFIHVYKIIVCDAVSHEDARNVDFCVLCGRVPIVGRWCISRTPIATG